MRFPMYVEGMFKFMFFLSSDDKVIMMAPISVHIDSDRILQVTGSRVLEVFKKYQNMKLYNISVYNEPSDYFLNYVDLRDNIIKNRYNRYGGLTVPMSSHLSISQDPQSVRTGTNVVFEEDVVTQLSLAIDRELYNKLSSWPNKGPYYIPQMQ